MEQQASDTIRLFIDGRPCQDASVDLIMELDGQMKLRVATILERLVDSSVLGNGFFSRWYKCGSFRRGIHKVKIVVEEKIPKQFASTKTLLPTLGRRHCVGHETL